MRKLPISTLFMPLMAWGAVVIAGLPYPAGKGRCACIKFDHQLAAKWPARRRPRSATLYLLGWRAVAIEAVQSIANDRVSV